MDRVRAATPHAAALGLVGLAAVAAAALQPIAETAAYGAGRASVMSGAAGYL
jgi:hypothetical protein